MVWLIYTKFTPIQRLIGKKGSPLTFVGGDLFL